MCKMCEVVDKLKASKDQSDKGQSDGEPIVIDLRGHKSEEMTELLNKLANVLETQDAAFDKRIENEARKGDRLARKLIVAAIARDGEEIASVVKEASDSQYTMMSTLVSMAADMDMIVTYLWGDEITSQKRIERFLKVAKAATNRLDTRISENEAARDAASDETKETDGQSA